MYVEVEVVAHAAKHRTAAMQHMNEKGRFILLDIQAIDGLLETVLQEWAKSDRVSLLVKGH
jgi:hypothetical protein